MTLVLGLVGLIYVPSKLFVPGDAAATVDHIRASPSLLRLGIASELVSQIALIGAVLVLYRLFKPVDESKARQLVVLGALVSAPILFVNLLNEFAALALTSGAGFLSAFDRRQLDALAYLFVKLHGRGYDVAEVFWGLWLFPFGLLVIRSGFIPRVLGILLLVAGVGYVGDCAVTLLLPQIEDVAGKAMRFLEQGEVPIIFWLLIWGARTPPVTGGSASATGLPSG
ncbi:MAG: DUF4386 domain-containing protein [Burkholderiaceae bacterium]|nr:DUF4386 domain-containing protein [Burkholderiaceae bacterium]